MKSLYVSKYRQAIAGKKQGSIEFCHGLRQGIPIALGYIPVSFTFGLMAVNGGIPVWTAILISLSNLTSAGQFAGTNLIIANASLLEITLTTFVVNIRYMLMSLSLSQKVAPQMAFLKRCIVAFGITDETFAIASLEKGEITFNYFLGLVTCPYWGWALGTALGALTSSVLPKTFQSSMGIALYAMFIALVVPAAKKSKAALVVAITAICISSLFHWGPYLDRISGGWSIIFATIIASGVGAVLYPREEDEFE
ncbi:MAG: hypothetical protein PWR06_1269 [Thermoanaerobacteraceae bacterium]|nr:hypothetical protein [Thermoanaerobacteraceae bacterium]